MRNKIVLFLVVIVIFNLSFIDITHAFEAESKSDSDKSVFDVIAEKFKEVKESLGKVFDTVTNLDQEFSNFVSNIVQYIQDGIIEFFVGLGDTILEMIVNPLAAAVPNFLLETVDIESIPIVNTIWKGCYTIGLVILVILTALGFGLGGNEAFRYDNFGLPEHILVRMFFTLGLMTASKTIAIHIYNIAGWMTRYIFNDVSLAISTSWDVSGVDGVTKLAVYGIFLIFAALLNILIFVILIIRILDLLVLTALSPISASTFVLPNTKFVATNHLKEYIAVVLVQFVIIVFLSLWTGLATLTDGLILKFTGDFAMQGLAKIVGQGVMMIVLMFYTITRPAWLKKILGVGSANSLGGLVMLARMFI